MNTKIVDYDNVLEDYQSNGKEYEEYLKSKQ